MANDGAGSDGTLMKIAIFCIAVSVLSTCMFAFYYQGAGDYNYDMINAYRAELTEFSGGQLVNETPWVLTGVYTPFIPQDVANEDIPDHIERDKGRSTGWLFGEKITTYPYLNQAANIKLDPSQKSNQLLTVGQESEYSINTGEKKWWAGGNPLGINFLDNNSLLGLIIGEDARYIWESGTANNWNYTGYRYVFDPTLPFSDEASSADGRLSLVWYDLAVNDSGLSGALEVYAGKDNEQVKLGTVSSQDIIGAVRSADGYVKTLDFNFEGTHLNLTIRFDPTVYKDYNNLQAAWDAGQWSMAISSASAGNFFDIENSNAFNVTAGSMLDTFIDIYTFDYSHTMPGSVENSEWIEFVMWLIVGLPMTLGMLFITMRLVGGIFKIF